MALSMKPYVPLTGWALCSAAAIIFAGCARNQEPAQAVETRSTPVVKSDEITAKSSDGSTLATSGSTPIKRSIGVPNAVTTPSGLVVPKGFQVNVFAEGLTNPRRMVIAPGSTPQKYDVFLAESKANRIRVLRETNGDGKADQNPIFVEGLNQPYGLAFTKDWLYVGNNDAIVRFPFDAGQSATDQPAQQISRLGGGGGHWTRNLVFSPDSKKLFLAMGSSCNTCEESDPMRAAITVMNPDGSNKKTYASGLRNPVGMAWRDGRELWAVVNERDNLGDDIPPDYLTLLKEGGFYGSPYAYTNLDRTISPDPQFGSKSPEKVRSTLAPTVPVQAHSAVLGVAFYPQFPSGNKTVGGSFRNEFSTEYSGDAFLALHGSWNRSEPTGYKIVRVDFQKGKPVSVSDFVTGFLKPGNVSGRPVDVQIAPDGSLLFSDDGSNKIWRVSRAK